MDITILDEAQGFDLDRGRAWLESRGWKRDNGACLSGWSKQKTWICDASGKDLLLEVPCIARIEGRTIQEVLREMNPRMRAGLPSPKAIAAHENGSGHWLAQSCVVPVPGILRVGYFDNMMGFVIYELAHRGTLTFCDIPPAWSFWPTDAVGNKVRWPTDSNGAML